VPIDFVSSHVYGNDSASDVFAPQKTSPQPNGLPLGKEGSRPDSGLGQAQTAAHLERIQRSYKNEPDVTDTVYMGPWLADTIRQCEGCRRHVLLDIFRRV